MRLLQFDDTQRVSFTEDLPNDRIPPYAILSHRWGPDSDEVKFEDVVNGTATSKPGYDKILFCIRQARHDRLRHCWIDTCCIDKSNNTELTKAINSMFRWYLNSEKCYVYLSDVPQGLPETSEGNTFRSWEQDFRASSWFTRGWTLQELLAPKSVDFFSKDGKKLGSKSSLENHIRDVTGIPVKALRENELSTFTIQDRFSWQNRRATKEEEDRYYSLLGIMNVSMTVIYGEGAEKARMRLEREIRYASKGPQPEDFSVTFNLANLVEVSNFVARRNELDKMREILIGDGVRRCLVVHGMGGIGKTQLSVAYAVQYRDNYSAVFWLNIKDDNSVKSDFVRVARQILRDHPSASQLSGLDLKSNVDAVIDAVKAWLSKPNNTHWLLIFDNYDNPKLPGSTDSDAVDIQSYLPETYQGSVIITTRSSEVDIGHRLLIKKLDDLQDSLSILASSSQRCDLLQDPEVERLARKLDGLPLALATAGAYLYQTPAVSCADYLRFYEDSWAKLQKTSPRLTSYDRTLYSTWQISFIQIEKQSLLAANLLRLWAYFGNQDLWFELLRHTPAHSPQWLQELTADELEFHNHVRVLCNHGLVEKDIVDDVGSESHGYSVHACLHAWAQTVLNVAWSRELGEVALNCIASHVPDTSSPEWWITSRRLMNHAAICHHVLEHDLRSEDHSNWAFDSLGYLYQDQGKLEEAEQMFKRALRGNEEILGPDHLSTLSTVNSLSVLYKNQGKLEEAKQMCERALQGQEKTLGLDHTSTLCTVNNLGSLYGTWGKLEEAEQMFERALRGYEELLGPEHFLTLSTVNNLGIIYDDQGKPEEAEQMYERALRGKEKTIGLDHTSTLLTINNLGTFYQEQGRPEEAEQMYERALRGKEKTIGLDHTSTLLTINNLSTFYQEQGRLEEAEQMYERVLRDFQSRPRTHQARIEVVEKALAWIQDQTPECRPRTYYKNQSSNDHVPLSLHSMLSSNSGNTEKDSPRHRLPWKLLKLFRKKQ